MSEMTLDQLAEQAAARLYEKIVVHGLKRLSGQAEAARIICEAIEVATQAQREQLEQAQDRLSDIQKLAKVFNLEDLVMHAPTGESETAMRLRLFEAIATLRVEVATNKGQPALVQRVCEIGASNLERAEKAEEQLAQVTQERDALQRQLRSCKTPLIEVIR